MGWPRKKKREEKMREGQQSRETYVKAGGQPRMDQSGKAEGIKVQKAC